MSDVIDDRIAEVARQMTAGASPDVAGFRRRVLARIDEEDARRSSFDVRRWVMMPAAGAAAIAIAVLAIRAPRNDVQPKPDGAQVARTEPAAPPVAPRTAVGAVAPRTVERTAAPRTIAPRTLADGIAPRTAPAVQAALEANAVASIAVAPLAVDTLSPESIQLEPLDSIAPIPVESLDITDTSRRNQ
jgi:hypothetical protein